MKKITAAILGLGIGLSSLSHAAGYAVIDLEKVVENSTYLKQQNASLEQSVKPQATKLEQLAKDIESIRQKGQEKGANVQQLQTQYQAKASEYQSIQQGVQSKMQASLQAMNRSFEAKVKQAAEQLRQENNLDFVLNKNAAIAYDKKNDLTDKMIQKVNALK
ncbi:OmpH family outer membrane protein [Acinetobacter stercoris]|uniref:Outer membrane protein (OmpH-like) n=1 Tax=Acinetobacter stercoris TaxID=2126983 RepID=A0A2U3MUA6_9GAMM|nr:MULTISPECIES: OmpH family outer membrane protein [Acinetobacter]SPL69006.1 Outer membrane protein (OmpH-like) [Acinetobacter stercoris]